MLLEIRDGSVSFRGETVLSHIHFHIRGTEKTAVVGRNGAGKSTLLHLIDGTQDLDSTEKTPGAGIFWSRRCRVTLLDQNPVHDPDLTVEELAGLADTVTADDQTREVRFHRLFTQLGFPLEDRHKRLGEFSGGEQTKIMLIAALVDPADVLLLDEPTNHLDLETTEWLEGELRRYPGAVVIVSHDRYFLDQVATVTWEISQGKLTEYPGNYSAYREEKTRRYEKQLRAWEAQQQEIARLNQLIETFKHKPRKAAFARSRQKILDRMEKIPKPAADDAVIHTGEILPARPGSRIVVDCDHLLIGYDRPIREISVRIRRGQKIGIFGRNGSGKTTFLKTLAGLVPPYDPRHGSAGSDLLSSPLPPSPGRGIQAGENAETVPSEGNGKTKETEKADNPAGIYRQKRFRIGENIDLAYYDQLSANISSELNVFDWFHERFPDMRGEDERQYLAGFLFHGDDLGKKVSSLSGGEKCRLVLAEILEHKPNFLLLDEPTNNMDIPAKETLESIFRDYKGTILFISHDRYFLSKVADALLLFPDASEESFHENTRENARESFIKRPEEVQDQAGQRNDLFGQRNNQSSQQNLEADRTAAATAAVPSVLYFPFGYDHWKERQNRIQRGEDVSITRQAEEQRLIEGLRSVPRKEHHERPLSDREANLDWRFGLNAREREPAEQNFRDADAALDRVADDLEAVASGLTPEELLNQYWSVRTEREQKAETACKTWTRTLLDWYDIYLDR